MNGTEDMDRDHPVSMFFSVFAGKLYFKSLLKNNGDYDGDPPIYNIGLGDCNQNITTYIGATGSLYVVGYPEEAGDYPMTLYVELANGKKFSFDFKVKYIDEE